MHDCKVYASKSAARAQGLSLQYRAPDPPPATPAFEFDFFGCDGGDQETIADCDADSVFLDTNRDGADEPCYDIDVDMRVDGLVCSDSGGAGARARRRPHVV